MNKSARLDSAGTRRAGDPYQSWPAAGDCPRRAVLGLGALAFLAGCGGRHDEAAARLPHARVGRFASPNPGSVNTLWLHAPEGLILIDTGRNKTGGRRVAAMLKTTRLPVLAMLITHPHPDHIGGMGELHQAFPKTPIYASKATTDWMRTNPLGFYQLARQADPDFPAELTFPDHTIAPGQPLEIGGLRLETAEFGPGESATATAFYEPTTRTLFAGDLVSNHATPALLEGHTCGWLGNLHALSKRFPGGRTLYPGHGAPADAATLISKQRTYLIRTRQLVGSAIGKTSPKGKEVDAAEEKSILAELNKEYPNYPRVAALPTLGEVNVKTLAKELLKAKPGVC